MNQLNYLIAVLLINYLFISCELSPTYRVSYSSEKYHSYGDRLKNELTQMDIERLQFKESLQSTTQFMDSIDDNMNRENAREYVFEFEIHWKDLYQRTRNLNQRYNGIIRSGNEYFRKLNEIAEKIHDTDYQNKQKDKNVRLQIEWQDSITPTRNKLEELNRLILKAEDYYNILLLESLRSSIEMEMDQLRQVTLEADLIIDDLKTYIEQCKEIIEV